MNDLEKKNCIFYFFIGFMLIISIVSVIIQVKIYQPVICKYYVSDFSIVPQIITALCAMLCSAIGISLSIQDNEYYGVKYHQLYSLRVENHFSYTWIVFLSIIICSLNALFYITNLLALCIGMSLIAVFFLFYLCYSETSILVHNEKALFKILHNYRIQRKKQQNEEKEKAYDTIVKNYIIELGIKKTYIIFKTENSKYNKELFFELLDVSVSLLKNVSDDTALKLLNNLFAVLLFEEDFNYFEILSEDYLQNVWYFTNTMRCLEQIDECKSELYRKVEHLIPLTFINQEYLSKTEIQIETAEKNEVQNNFISYIIIVLVAESIKKGNLGFLKVIRRAYSASTHFFNKKSDFTIIFAVISLQIYYLCNSEPDYPKELKENLRNFIDEKGNEDGFRIWSWKELFSEFAENFNVEYKKFYQTVLKFNNTLEYYLYNNGAKKVILFDDYPFKWYLTHYLNRKEFTFDFENFITTDAEKRFATQYEQDCFENKEFKPSDEMLKIVSFFVNDENFFQPFEIIEKTKHVFSCFINEIRMKEVEKNIENAKEFDNDVWADKIKSYINNIIKSEKCFDNSISLVDEKNISRIVVLEKRPDIFQYEEAINKELFKIIRHDLFSVIKYTEIYNDSNFNDNIKKIIEKEIKYATHHAISSVPYWINDVDLRTEYTNKLSDIEEIDSKIIFGNVLIANGGLKFNFELNRLNIKNLTPEEIYKRVEKYKQPDGQYYYNDAYVSAEKMYEIVEKTFCVCEMDYTFKVISSLDDIFTIYPSDKVR